jgi:hypothetical protein
MAQTYSDRFARILAQLIDETIKEEIEYMGAGAIDNISDYKYRAGVIYGLRKVIDLMDEADAINNGKERNL